MHSSVLGVDVSKAELVVYLLVGQQGYPARFANQPEGFGALCDWLGGRASGRLHICLEATGRYGQALAEYLHERGYGVSVVNPARIHAYARSQLSRTKTDAVDARLIARYCQKEKPPFFVPPSAEQGELTEQVRYRQTLKACCTQLKNQLAAGGRSPLVRASLKRRLVALQAELDALQRSTAALIAAHPALAARCALLVSIPGIGPTTAARILAEVPCLEAFEHAGQLAAYAGLCPAQHQSGTSVRGRPRLAKTGNAQLRQALYLPAVVARQHNPRVAAFATRLAARGKPKMVVQAAAMRKLLTLAYGVLKSGKPFDPHYQPPT